MRQSQQRTPPADVTFDRRIGLFKARDRGATTCTALGRTPEEALMILNRVRSRWLEVAARAAALE